MKNTLPVGGKSIRHINNLKGFRPAAFIIVLLMAAIGAGAQSVDYDFAPDSRGNIYDIELLADGRILVAGDFNTINEVGQGLIARLNADGSLDTTFIPNIAGFGHIGTIAVQADGKIVIGGRDIIINSQPGRYLARLNADGSLDTTFNPTVTFPNNPDTGLVIDVKLQTDGKILVGGRFTSVNNQTRNYIARLNTNGTIDETFNAIIPFGGNFAYVSDLELESGGKIYLSGVFLSINGVARRNMARIKPDGTVDEGFRADTDTVSSTIHALPDGKVLVAGNFQAVSGQIHNGLARLNADGTVDESFNADVPGNGSSTIRVLANGKYLVAGGFHYANGNHNVFSIALFNTDGTLDLSFSLRMNAVYDIELMPDGRILLGGNFTSVSGQPRNRLARLLKTSRTPFDFDFDGKADIAVYRPTAGEWYASRSSDGAFLETSFGAGGDLITPADFDRDGKIDIAVFRPSNGSWYRLNSADNSFSATQFGADGDLPVPGDFDGDGRADICVFRPSNGYWYRLNSSDNEFVANQFGAAGDQPVLADFDRDFKNDLAVFRPSNGTWYNIDSYAQHFHAYQFGASGDKPVPADYDGDKKTDLAVYRPTTGSWYIVGSTNNSFAATQFGTAEDKPAPADFDGDGKPDFAVFRPSTGSWYVLRSTAGFIGVQFGASGDVPVANAFVR